jgi:hypothetical protein
MTCAMHPALGMLAEDGGGERVEACDGIQRGLTYLRVSGVALPFCLGPSEPTSASPFAPLGLMMDIDGGARFVMAMRMFDVFWLWRLEGQFPKVALGWMYMREWVPAP